MKYLPAAAIPEGSTVWLRGDGGQFEDFVVDKIDNSTPLPGMITWYDHLAMRTAAVKASKKIGVVKLP